MDYGVQPTGFVRKPLARILTEIEANNMTEFGPDVIQTSVSPLGQINGVFAELSALLWELAEDVYQSYDPDQAENTRLDILGRLRLLNRGGNETDESYRQAITNAGRARNDIQDLARAVIGVEGVTYAHVFVNDSEIPDENGLAPGTLAVAVIGGNSEEIAYQMRRFVVPGIVTYGNERVSTNIDGYCRSASIIRPVPVPITLQIRVRRNPDRLGCPAPAIGTIKTALVSDFQNLMNGEDISIFRVRGVIESQFPGVEVVSFTGERPDVPVVPNQPVLINFIEIGTLDFDDLTITDA